MQVVNIKKIGGLKEGDVYIGRRNSYYNVDSSLWKNPFPITNSCNRDCVIKRYESYIEEKLENEWWRKELKKLSEAKRLVCWCAPLPCHGDILVKMMIKHGYM